MSDVYTWFSGLATVSGLAYFMAGFAFAYLQHCVRQKMRHREVRIPWHLAGIAIGTATIMIVTLQSSLAYNTAKETATQAKECQEEFNRALTARAKITSENDDLSETQRLIVFTWMHDLIFPPEPYASMPTDDPRRQAYGYTLTINAERTFQASLDRQNELEKEREKHPYPDPTCGNN